ncbi:MAG: helix-turn-helix domain-containing protein [Deltaproteobacteria bacterium]|nr:helix-turn-helix domain-containing protein [Deltaproteobacteria bacterium]MBI2974030.1 helix-turn-helix domain-containing protein [Deltaproteobacteria bacterium]
MVDDISTSKLLNNVMTTSEVMKYLKVSRKTVLKLVHEGKIPAQKVGKDFRYLKSEIDAFLRGNEAAPSDISGNKSYFNVA